MILLSNELDSEGMTREDHYYYSVRSYVSVYKDTDDVPVDKVRILSVYLTPEGELTAQLTPIRAKVLLPHTLTDHSRINDVIRAFTESTWSKFAGIHTLDGNIPPLPARWGGVFSNTPMASMPDPAGEGYIYLYKRGIVLNRVLNAVQHALK